MQHVISLGVLILCNDCHFHVLHLKPANQIKTLIDGLCNFDGFIITPHFDCISTQHLWFAFSVYSSFAVAKFLLFFFYFSIDFERCSLYTYLLAANVFYSVNSTYSENVNVVLSYRFPFLTKKMKWVYWKMVLLIQNIYKKLVKNWILIIPKRFPYSHSI